MKHDERTDLSEIDAWLALQESDATLLQPDRLLQRIDALDRLESFAWIYDLARGPLAGRAAALQRQLEVYTAESLEAMRRQVRSGIVPSTLLERLVEAGDRGVQPGETYDALDTLVSGILQLEAPSATAGVERPPETVFYQPTPARHVFDLLAKTRPGAADIVMDLGAGLGHVVLLTVLCTPARGIGIEREPDYVDCARRCAASLALTRARFLVGDAREADLSAATVFYLYTPFSGSILDHVLRRLQREASMRSIRIATYGACTQVLAGLAWLEAEQAVDPQRVAVFHARG